MALSESAWPPGFQPDRRASLPGRTPGPGIFALSTYDTDYVLVRDRDLATAIAALRGKGHIVHES